MADWVDSYFPSIDVLHGLNWGEPVPVHTMLPSLADDGDVCMVEDTDKLYVCVRGQWRELESRGGE
jgi:hypothetical protein